MIKDIFSFIFTRAVWENVLVTFLVGGPLSIYLAFLVNRFAAFRQIKTDMILEISALKLMLLQTPNYLQGFIQLKWILENPMIRMGAEEQWDAMHQLKRVRDESRNYFIGEFDKIVTSKKFNTRPECHGEQWIEIQRLVFNGAVHNLRRWLDEVQSIRPCPLVIIGLMPSNKTRNRWDKIPVLRQLAKIFDVISKRRIHWQRFKDYIDGKSEEL